MRTRLALIIVACALYGVAARAVASADAPSAPRRALRVCADPNNLPFSNDRLEGFENRLADLLSEELQAPLQYTWSAQRRGYVRNTIRAGLCDVLMGVPRGFEMTLVSRPYYRSSYVFVWRKDERLRVRTFDDPVLRRVRVGVQLVGNDGQNTPPAHALADRGVFANVVGYTLYGNYLEANPPARIIEAVAHGDVDVAAVWGPLAGYFVPKQATPLAFRPVAPQIDRNGMPLAFDIGIGVSRAQPALRDEIDRVLVRRRAAIDRLLDEYGVPRVPPLPADGGAHGR
jgi:quinoprotein dehydrogenase-associated probable ABC transporter substrate-binding protein